MSDIEAIELRCHDLRARILTLGATLQSLDVPDRNGRPGNIVLGYHDPEAYRANPMYLGAVIGRYANRIAGGRFALDGVGYRLACNDGPNHLHGGPDGFDRQFWSVAERGPTHVTLRLVSKAGAGGYPGRLEVEARYTLEHDGLVLMLAATGDAATIVNLTHHAYFNLAGEASGTSIAGHWLRIAAARYTPVDAALIPTGEIAPVFATPFDFRSPKPVGRDIGAPDPQIAIGAGYDHNYVLDAHDGSLRRAATLCDPDSGRVLDLFTTEPGLQFYTGNHLGSVSAGSGGRVYPRRGGLCLEPQRFPDTPNRPDFPSARLEAGGWYTHRIAFRFRTAETVREAFPES